MPPARNRRRADAERSIASILDAAVEALADDPEASMAEIARRAGVVRATIYVHFPTREALIEAVTEHAVAEVAQLIEAADPAEGDAEEALRRVLAATWRGLGRFHALVAITTRLPSAEQHRRHEAVMTRLAPLIERGQREGAFRADVSTEWHLAMMLALVHAASAAARDGRIGRDDVAPAMVETVLGALRASS